MRSIKLSFRQILMFGMMLLGYGVSITAKAENSNSEDKSNHIHFVTKEQIEELGLPNEIILLNKTGKFRYLQPGEKVQVHTHAEDNFISFTTFDHYSIRIDKNDFQTPRNIGGGIE